MNEKVNAREANSGCSWDKRHVVYGRWRVKCIALEDYGFGLLTNKGDSNNKRTSLDLT